MCGIVGVISKSYNGLTIKEKDIFHELLYIDALRGEDSTGVMAVDNDGNLDLAKEAQPAGYYQTAPEYHELLKGSVRSGAALIGHNRKATKGNIVDENAHPFVVDDRIVLVHNGTLYGDHKSIADTEVDSHAIAHLIHEKGDDVEAALRELNGAYALVWYDVQNRTMNFVRNSQRPLTYVETHSGWFWASEGGMLAWILNRNSMAPVTGGTITMLPEGELHSFKRDGRTWKKTVKKLDLTRKTTSGGVFNWHGYEDCEDVMGCGYRGDTSLRQTADWRNAPVTTPASGTVLTLPTPPKTVPRDEDGSTPAKNIMQGRVRIRDGEIDIARKGGFVMDVGRFQETAGNYSAGDWALGTLFDYQYVKGESASQGVFVYARVDEYPDLLVRCYLGLPTDPTVSKEDFEMQIINLTTAERRMAFKTMYKTWHALQDGGRTGTDGFGVLYCADMAPITEITALPNVKEEC